MKCKQCGWENPDNRERCAKCNNVLVRPRTEETQTSVYDAERTVIDRTSIGYGGYPAAEQTQPYNARPYNAEPHNAQPYNPNPYNGQPYNARPYNGQAYGNQPFNAGQAYNNTQPSYPDMPPSQPQQSFNPAFGQQPYGYPQPNQYGAMPERQQYPQAPEAGAEERYCPECDAELPAGATECPVCHTKIQAETIVVVEGVCPDCGAEVAPAQRFCHSCGSRLDIRENISVETSLSMQPQAATSQPAQPEHAPAQPYVYPAAKDEPGTADEGPGMAEADIPASYDKEDADDTVAAGPLSAKLPECRLQMLGGEDSRTIYCAGDEVELYRGNTDPANNTIARDLQARITFADGKWCIEDCSALQTTFIRPSRKMELHDGDIIVMGNREFIFKS